MVKSCEEFAKEKKNDLATLMKDEIMKRHFFNGSNWKVSSDKGKHEVTVSTPKTEIILYPDFYTNVVETGDAIIGALSGVKGVVQVTIRSVGNKLVFVFTFTCNLDADAPVLK